MGLRWGLLGVWLIAAGAFAAPAVDCGPAWQRSVEQRLPSGDGQGHGPDLGSAEWRAVVAFKLGLRGRSDMPPIDSDAWCTAVEQALARRNANPGPSFDCKAVPPASVAAQVCADASLAALDRRLAWVYQAALKRARNEHPPVLKAAQRGWVKGRDDCWKAAEPGACVRDAYVQRIAELQARYRLIPPTATVTWQCNGRAADEVIATYFRTEPPTLIAERGDSVSLMFVQPSASGARYQGRNESLWEHQGEATITWGFGAPEMRCVRQR
ncbi:MAG: MliC family protein [Hydrogenophaga sp.]|uniref:MliC family protein n=1 Tax=Hydrogenophaga sp. TaxID=1904254 RepID=UPI001D6812FE|nr:MliC family protein [Hydrogenophaga sp.]MBX3610877.1 MliC family protein [Hydrogenophaga sp.]